MTIGPAVLASATWFVLWALFDWRTHILYAITVERDVAAGIRLGGLLIANGLILGTAVAGDWVSTSATLRDFAMVAWAAVALTVLACLPERALQPTPERLRVPVFGFGVLPAALWMATASWFCEWVGLP